MDNLLMNNKLNYFYKLVFLSIKSLEININVIIIFLLGFYLFPYAVILLFLEYLYNHNDKIIGNFSILLFAYLIKIISLNQVL